MEVKTRVGVIECPEPKQVSDRVRFWAEAIFEIIKTEELYGVMGAALEEAYQAGKRDALAKLLVQGRGEIVDVEWKVVEADSVEPVTQGPKFAGSASSDQVAGPTEQPVDAILVSGSVPEGAECERGNQEEVEEAVEVV